MNADLERCLDDLERRISPETEERLEAEWHAFAAGMHGDGLFRPRRGTVSPPGTDWPKIPINAALEDFELMALHQYGLCSEVLASGGGALMNVRANYGTSIIPSMFGVRLYIMPEETDTLPTSWPLEREEIDRILDGGVPKARAGVLSARALDMSAFFAEIGARRPLLARYAPVYHPDTQGPMDMCELLWGSSLFYALIEEPDRVKALLNLITGAYLNFMAAWRAAHPIEPEYNRHWGMCFRGAIMLRNDSCMNLSPEMVREFVAPRDQLLLDAFGGGAVHFCGRGDHFVSVLAGLRGVTAVNISQPELNNLETILSHTVDRGVNLIGLAADHAERLLASGRPLHGRVHAL